MRIRNNVPGTLLKQEELDKISSTYTCQVPEGRGGMHENTLLCDKDTMGIFDTRMCFV